MKKRLALLLVLLLTFSLVACGNDDNPDPSDSDNPETLQTDNQDGESTDGGEEKTDSSNSDVGVGNPNDEVGSEPWPETDLTALLPTPAVGNVIQSSLQETFAMIEVSWTYEEALAYVQQLQEAGFGDDAVEKFEQQKVINRSNNGVNIDLVYMDDTLTIITLIKE